MIKNHNLLIFFLEECLTQVLVPDPTSRLRDSQQLSHYRVQQSKCKLNVFESTNLHKANPAYVQNAGVP